MALGVDERGASQKQVTSVTSGHEVKIHLRHHTLSDCCYRKRRFNRNRRRSVGWASYCFEGSELWMEFSAQYSDRWQNGRQPCAGTPLRSLRASGASCTDGLGRAKLLRLSANDDGAERAARANICIHSNMAGYR